jgi:hypothetical protein
VRWYQEVAARVRSRQDAVVALNPGVAPDEAYLSVGDIVVTYEGPGAAYGSSSQPPWCADHPPDRFWHLVHSTPERLLAEVVRRSRELGAGLLYVTDGGGSNPWGQLPSYWDTELGLLRAGAAAPAADRTAARVH